MSLATETLLGPYQIVARLGAGAMGEIYRAWDTRLRRYVALKTIPEEALRDPERLRRFKQEARAIGALNHPNILTIHDLGLDETAAYLVTELIDGQSLRDLLAKGPLSVRKALDIAIQVAEGVAAAHEAGVVHRDLKPENIMISDSGRVKILDFGLAKSGPEIWPDGEAGDPEATAPGLLLGTAAYMSPEQARGGDVRLFTDQFALGLILYEMLTGEQPFLRETPLQSLSAILTEEAPPVQRGPAPLRWLITRCLHKDPEHRYASTLDLVRELHNIRDHLHDSVSSKPAVMAEPGKASRPARNPARLLLIALAMLSSAALGALFHGWLSGRPNVHPAFTPFATTAALEVFPSWSPNGQTLAYSADTGGTFQIFARSLRTAMPVQLTRSADDCFFPFWAPDGARVFYISQANGRPALWSIGATGGSPQLVAENVVQAAIAPDGKTYAALRNEERDGISFSLWMGQGGQSLTKYRTAPLDSKKILPWSYLRFSPDGKTLGAWLSLWNGRSEFWTIPAEGGGARTAFPQLGASPLAREFAWLADSRNIVFGERSGLSMGSHLWRADLRSGGIVQLTSGPGGEYSPSVSRDGRRISFSSMHIDYDLAEIDLATGVMKPAESTAVLEVSPSLSPDGSQTALVTDRAGRPQVWLQDRMGRTARPLVTESDFGQDRTQFLFDTAFSPDGLRVAYRRAGEKDEMIWISTTAGDPPVRLSTGSASEFQRGPSWSPDGNWIAYFSMRGGRYVTMRARVGGSQAPELIAENAGTYPRWSPRGDWIASIALAEGATLVKPDGSRRLDAGTGMWLLHGWSGDGRILYGVQRSADRKLRLVALEVENRQERAIADLGEYPAGWSYGVVMGALPLRGFALKPDGKSVLTSVLRARSDVWMMEEN